MGLPLQCVDLLTPANSLFQVFTFFGKFQMTYFYNVSSFFSFWSCRWQYSNFMSRSQLSTMLNVSTTCVQSVHLDMLLF